jgi:hypothetical protein
MQRNATIRNYFTDYQFNSLASDEEILQIALKAERMGLQAESKTIENILRYSAASEVKSVNKTRLRCHIN